MGNSLPQNNEEKKAGGKRLKIKSAHLKTEAELTLTAISNQSLVKQELQIWLPRSLFHALIPTSNKLLYNNSKTLLISHICR